MKQKWEWMLDCQLKDDYIGKKSYRILSYESNDQCRKIMRGVSPIVFLSSHLASRWLNLESFIWYTWHLRSGDKVTYTVKVYGQGGQGGRDLSLCPPYDAARQPRAPPAALPAVPAS